MLLGMESTDSRMNRLARNEIYFGREIPLEETGARDRRRSPTTRCSNWRRPSLPIRQRMGMVMLGDLKGHKFGADVFSELK